MSSTLEKAQIANYRETASDPQGSYRSRPDSGARFPFQRKRVILETERPPKTEPCQITAKNVNLDSGADRQQLLRKQMKSGLANPASTPVSSDKELPQVDLVGSFFTPKRICSQIGFRKEDGGIIFSRSQPSLHSIHHLGFRHRVAMTLVPNHLKVQAAKQFCIRRIGYAKTQVHSMIVVERRMSAKEGIILYKSAVSERIASGWIRLDGNAYI